MRSSASESGQTRQSAWKMGGTPDDFACCNILSKEDGPFAHCRAKQLVPSGVRLDVVIALHELEVGHHECVGDGWI